MAHNRTFSVILDPQPEGGFTVLVPALPEIVTEGDTEEEALAMAEDAIRLVLEDRAARGGLREPLPPRPQHLSYTPGDRAAGLSEAHLLKRKIN